MHIYESRAGGVRNECRHPHSALVNVWMFGRKEKRGVVPHRHQMGGLIISLCMVLIHIDSRTVVMEVEIR